MPECRYPMVSQFHLFAAAVGAAAGESVLVAGAVIDRDQLKNVSTTIESTIGIRLACCIICCRCSSCLCLTKFCCSCSFWSLSDFIRLSSAGVYLGILLYCPWVSCIAWDFFWAAAA